MLNSKQRSALKSLAVKLDPVVTVGKSGDNENVYREAENLLEARELVKFSVLKNSQKTAEEYLQDFAKKLKAEPVHAIGNKFVLYRKSKREDITHIQF